MRTLSDNIIKMKQQRTWLLKVIVPLLLIILILIAPVLYAEFIASSIFKADHYELLTACREIIINKDNYRNDSSELQKYHAIDSNIAPINDNVPSVIMEMKPRYISIHDDHVIVSLYAPFRRVGFIGFTQNAEQFGTEKIIDGLWFWNGNMTGNKIR